MRRRALNIHRVRGTTNHLLSLYLPIVLVGAVGLYRGSLVEAHHGIIAVAASRYTFVVPANITYDPYFHVLVRGLSRLVTEFLKNRVGMLVPEILSCVHIHPPPPPLPLKVA